MDKAAEADLMTRVASHDAAAYQSLLDAHLAPISRFTQRMLQHRADAEDITQEVFVRLWQKAGHYDASKARLGTWLHQIAHNLCIDLIRKRKLTSDVDDGFEPSSAIDSTLSNDQQKHPLEHQLHQEQRWQNVTHAMLRLPARQRSAIIMCHHQGLSNKQAADILDVSIDALESLLSRGRRTLRSWLRDSPLITHKSPAHKLPDKGGTS